MSEIIWGPEIAVDGKRPEWLKDKDWVTFRNTASYSEKWSEKHHAEDIRFGRGIRSDPYVTLIRLPADHPHYATQQPRTAPSGGEMGPVVVGVLVQALAAMIYEATHLSPCKPNGDHDCTIKADTLAEARGALARGRALLPEPVDAVTLLARKVCNAVEASRCASDDDCAPDYTGGFYDDTKLFVAVRRALAAGDR